MADRRPGPNFKPAAPSRTAPSHPHTGLSSAGGGAGPGARTGASVRRNLFQQSQPAQPVQPIQPTLQATAAAPPPPPPPESQQQFQGHYLSQQSSHQSQGISQTSQAYNYQPHPPYHQEQASYLTQPYHYPQSYSQQTSSYYQNTYHLTYPAQNHHPQDPSLSLALPNLPHLQQYHQLPPQPASSSSSSSSQEANDDVKMASSSPQSDNNPHSSSPVRDPEDEIVVRDKETGEYDLGNDPPTPPYDEDTEAIMEARKEAEEERERLADAVREWLTEHEAEGHVNGEIDREKSGGGGRGGRGGGMGLECGMDTEGMFFFFFFGFFLQLKL